MDANLNGEQRDQTLIGDGIRGCDQQYDDEAMTRINHDLTQAPQIIPPPVGCHTSCAICEENYYTVDKQQHSRSLRGTGREWPTVYKDFFKDDDAAEKSFQRQLKLVTEDFNYLADILRTHGDLIANRWTKKSSHKRGALLGSAAHICFGIWPPVTEHDFAGQQEGGTGKVSFAEALSVNALFGSGACGAWIDIEEFAQDRMKLLSFLHVRSAYPPCDWATFDAREMVRYFERPFHWLFFHDKCVRMSGKEFGRLVDFDVKLLHSGEALGYPRARATLYIQGFMASGLRAIVDSIVDGAPPSGNLKWTKLVSDRLRNSAVGTRCGAYDTRALLEPPRFDSELLLEMATDQLNRIVDEVELLQQDVEYMRDYALNMKANISWDTNVSASMKWSCIAGTIAALWTHRLSQWQKLVQKSQELVLFCKGHPIAIATRCDLPIDVETAIVEYGAMIRDMIEVQLLHLRLDMTDMHALRDTYTKYAQNGRLLVRQNDNDLSKKRPSSIHKGLEFAATSLAVLTKRCYEGLSRSGFARFSAELSKVRPDKRVDETFLTITSLDAMQLVWLSGYIVSQGQPRSSHDDDFQSEKRMDIALSQYRPSGTHGRNKYKSLGPLLRDFCECPWPNNRNSSAWLDRKTEARRLLAAFWTGARETWQLNQQDQHAFDSVVVDAVVGTMAFDESPRYRAEVLEERTTFEDEFQRSQAAKCLKKDNTQVLQSVWGSEPTEGTVRIKAKTILTGKDSTLDIEKLDLKKEPVVKIVEQPLKPKIAVKQDSKRVFDKIFSRTATVSNFRWSHLVNALTDAGMVATQAAGSAVRFKNDRGSIVFHAPHGTDHDSTLSVEFLRYAIGKRLTKWFSWDAETFVERVRDK